jgi:TATA-box binding protein (TBP) (component of TFIID and TFIIIB)
MLVVTNSAGIKMIIFNSGKFRIMGNFIPMLKNAKKEIKKFKLCMEPQQLKCQTSTVVTKLYKKNINLPKLFLHLQLLHDNKYIGYCELESFPAIALKIWEPLHVNVFASGKIVITGVGCCNMFKCMYIKQLLCNCINMIC